jgi:hypothetical protein
MTGEHGHDRDADGGGEIAGGVIGPAADAGEADGRAGYGLPAECGVEHAAGRPGHEQARQDPPDAGLGVKAGEHRLPYRDAEQPGY